MVWSQGRVESRVARTLLARLVPRTETAGCIRTRMAQGAATAVLGDQVLLVAPGAVDPRGPVGSMVAVLRPGAHQHDRVTDRRRVDNRLVTVGRRCVVACGTGLVVPGDRSDDFRVDRIVTRVTGERCPRIDVQ